MLKKANRSAIRVQWSSSPVHIVGLNPSLYDTETGLNIWCVDYYRTLRLPHRLHHSANERKGRSAGVLASRQGQSKGMPDILIFGLSLAVELKVGNNAPSPEQASWLDYLASIGWSCHVIRSAEAFTKVVHDRLLSMREGN